jgi:glycosyltransferase involved in cell wall biosynthesis
MVKSDTSDAVNVSVIVCTYNRAEGLINLLDSIAASSSNKGIRYEIVVVNNNSPDNTSELCRQFIENNQNMAIRYVLESRQGIAIARNRGISEAKGDIIVFVDDDEIVDRGWLTAIVKPFFEKNADCVGGRIHLRFTDEQPRPKWLTDELEGFVGKLDHGERTLQVTDRSTPLWSGNIAMSKDIFADIGLFDVNLKRGSDADMFQRVLNSGSRIFYEPEARVWHVLDEQRLRKNWFRFLHFTAGKQQALYHDKISGRKWFRVPRYLYPQLIRSILRYVAVFIQKGPSGCLRKEMNVWWFIGYMKGCRQK